MKKLGKMMAVLMMLTLVLAACSQAVPDEKVPAGTSETMDKDAMDKDTMDKDAMDKDAMDKDSMDKEDANKEDMDDGQHSDDMKDDDMSDSTAMMNEGEAAPQFSLMNLDGETVSLADFKGEKVYVKYWASWCSICLAGMEELDTLSAEAEGFRVISIVTPDYKGEQSVADFKEWFPSRKADNLVVLLDTDGVYAKEFGVRAYPTSAYIGSDGVLIKVLPGHVDNDQITATFEGIY